MNIRVKMVSECSEGEYGTCQVVSDKTIQIEISEKRNTDVYQFCVTLLHELLHAWMFVMKANGLHIKKEHKWIYSVQSVVFEALKLVHKRKLA